MKKKIITENTSQYADVRLQYYLVCAWYFALVHDSAMSTDVFVKNARELSDIIIPTDLQKIEEVIIPCANIFFEVGIEAHQFNLCQKAIELIEAENKEIVDPKNRVVIPAEVRSIISSKTT